MESKNETVSPANAFVARSIARVKTDSACRAALRRADNPATDSYAWEYLLPFCRLEIPAERFAYGLAGAAIARAMPEKDGTLDVGAALRNCCPGGNEDDRKTELARLRRLLACDSVPELAAILRRVVRYLQSKGEPLSYRQLLNDTLYWNDNTRIRWTRSFFRSASAEENGTKGEESHAVSDQIAD